MNVKRNNKSNDMIRNKINEKHKFINKLKHQTLNLLHNHSGIVYVCFVLFVVCLYICVCECLL